MLPPFSRCRVLKESEYPAWDHYVSEHPDASAYHSSIWRHIFGRAFGKSWYVVGVIENGRVWAGVPLVHMKSGLFGNFLSSIPYVNYGGMLYQDSNDVDALVRGVRELAGQLGAEHVEYRHFRNHMMSLPARSEKVSMWLDLPRSAEELLKSFKPKLRSQVRKGEKNGLTATQGGVELLEEFYSVFARNMRDLGTPVYGKELFRLILEAFPKSARIVVVHKDSLPVAGGFLLGFRGRLEIPWASSLREFNHLQSNMFLYWNCLQYACEEGYQNFDFGRSTKGCSTYKFKEQWGAKPIPHYWHYDLHESQALPQLNPQNPKFRLAISLWQRLPVSMTKVIGPMIARHLP